jgi:hypothetical protein
MSGGMPEHSHTKDARSKHHPVVFLEFFPVPQHAAQQYNFLVGFV